MTIDDLRTRAREAAWQRLTPFPPISNAQADGYEDGFADGAEWHAAQQPSREQLRTEFLYRLRTVASHYRAAGKHGDPVEPGLIEREADLAVLALLNGAGS